MAGAFDPVQIAVIFPPQKVAFSTVKSNVPVDADVHVVPILDPYEEVLQQIAVIFPSQILSPATLTIHLANSPNVRPVPIPEPYAEVPRQSPLTFRPMIPGSNA
jgi:hypothetical protein